jgi:hypothetical protein
MAAAAASWPEPRIVPADRTSLPARRSSPAARTCRPGSTARSMITVPPSSSAISTGTTASAPVGMAAPVAIATAAPDAISPGKGRPARARPKTCSRTGADAVSAARTANPSMAELANRGRSAGAPRSSANTRPDAWGSGTGRGGSGRTWSRSRRRTAAGVQRFSDTGPPCGAVTLAACVSLGGSQSSIPLESLSARLKYRPARMAPVRCPRTGDPSGRAGLHLRRPQAGGRRARPHSAGGIPRDSAGVVPGLFSETVPATADLAIFAWRELA